MSTEITRRPGERQRQLPVKRQGNTAALVERIRGFRFTVSNVLIIVGVMALTGLLAVGVTSVAKSLKRNQDSPAGADAVAGKVVEAQKSSRVSTEVAKISEANFDYLVPKDGGAWTYDPAGEVYDKTTGVVKYGVQRQSKGLSVTVSQQAFPEKLGSRQTAAFADFTKQYKVVANQEAGAGTAYFMPALENGQPSKGTDTVIYATDKVLMFARGNSIMGYGEWAELFSTMKKR